MRGLEGPGKASGSRQATEHEPRGTPSACGCPGQTILEGGAGRRQSPHPFGRRGEAGPRERLAPPPDTSPRYL